MARYKPGTITNFSGSMAQAIETEYEAIWNSLKEQPLPNEGREDRRMLFVAIARGVMKHLEQNVDDGIVVTYDSGTLSGIRANVDINSD